MELAPLPSRQPLRRPVAAGGHGRRSAVRPLAGARGALRRSARRAGDGCRAGGRPAGPPGSGKSTLLRRLELDLSRDALGPGDIDAAAPLTFFVSLNQYRSAAPDAALPAPKDWLAERWAARYPQLPPLADLAAERGIVFLLDGLNEMPHRTAADYRERIGLWRQFLLETVTPGSGHRAVIACRSLDYSAPLSTPALRVPQVQVEPLTDHEVEAFLRRYSPGHGHELWAQLRGTNVLGALRVAVLPAAGGGVGGGHGAVGGRCGGAVHGGGAAGARARDRAAQPAARAERAAGRARLCAHRGRTGLADALRAAGQGALIRRLAELAYVIQVAAIDGASSQVRVGYAEALALLGGEGGTAGDGAAGRCAAEVIGVGAALGLLDEDRAADEVMFRHQLVQEYFAARRLAREPNAERVRREWRAEAVTPRLDDVLDGLDPADELPPLPSTGWEETTLLAAAMADAPEVIVRGVMATNLALAGRAAALPEVRGRLGDAVIDDVRWALVRRSRDPAADLRERIDCGHTVGELGDPRFERRVGAYGTYAWPPFVAVDGGLYPIGEDEAIERPAGGTAANREAHEPRHLVDVCAFQIGQFPVTNAEWSLFMAAGGYDDERWWETDDGRRWRRGALANEGSKGNDRRWRARFLDDPRLFDVMEAQGRFPSLEALERWRGWLQLDDAAFEAALADRWAMRRATEPAFWADVRLNRPTQPVVGICWYEARAYCAWLSAQSGRAVRLPTEVEWEAAARGGDGRRYPWGEAFHRLNANTLATRVQRSTPVGVFPSGDSPAGVSDASGNTYEWTASLWGEQDDAPTFGYPYDSNDGREAITAGPTLLRVVRGGSGGLEHLDARPAYRNRYHPTYRYYGVGFRLAISSTPTAPSPPPNTRTSRCRCGSVAAPVPPRRPTS
ncbi:MAG: SUMF1/EgtB/PvdO family nonheme iron enzyme [Ardenticatenales bacterium]|nr:SUMF1/EgtB/PvdO family nonheme iron enzyme [Ardenticatenales bacterium]